jgi:hypothetical protein
MTSIAYRLIFCLFDLDENGHTYSAGVLYNISDHGFLTLVHTRSKRVMMESLICVEL